MVKVYLDNKIRRRKSFIYLSNGRWIVIVLVLLISIFSLQREYFKQGYISDAEAWPVGIMLLNALPTLALSLCFMMYLIPHLFKNNRYRQFWIGLVITFLISVITEFIIMKIIFHYGLLIQNNTTGTDMLLLSVKDSFGMLIGITGILFFIELLEEIKLKKETANNIDVYEESNRKLSGTRTDLPYMLQSLRGIKSRLHEGENASNTMLLFAEILRYKLYGYEQKYIQAESELRIIQDIVQFYNGVITDPDAACTLDVSGSYDHLLIEKQALVNIIYPFLDNPESPYRSPLIYILFENEKLYIAIDLTNTKKIDFDIDLAKVKESLTQLETNATFEVSDEATSSTINICLILREKFPV